MSTKNPQSERGRVVDAPAKARRTRGKPTEVDAHVGRRIRLRRSLLGLSQERLAAALQLTFQQVQKYETGSNRIGAGRLYALSRALGVPISYFFEGLDEPSPQDQPSEVLDPDLFSRDETADLVRSFSTIPRDNVRRSVLELTRAIAAGPEKSEKGHEAPTRASAKRSR